MCGLLSSCGIAVDLEVDVLANGSVELRASKESSSEPAPTVLRISSIDHHLLLGFLVVLRSLENLSPSEDSIPCCNFEIVTPSACFLPTVQP